MRCAPLLFFALAACTGSVVEGPDRTEGYAPIYATVSPASTIAIEPAKPTSRAGKIYAYGSYAFQVEQYKGIHVIAHARSKEARKIAFLNVPLCTEIAIKENHLYTNNVNDLVVFNVKNPAQPQLVNRVKDAFPHISQDFPPVSNTFFECVNPSKGVVVGWEQKILHQPKCRR